MRRNEESGRPVLFAHQEDRGLQASAEVRPQALSGEEGTPPRKRQAITQFPMQILVPEETRDALRQRSMETGASIRHIILRSLAADGFPVPKSSRWQD